MPMNSSSIFGSDIVIDDLEKGENNFSARSRLGRCYSCLSSNYFCYSFCKCFSLFGIALKYCCVNGLATFLPCFRKQDDEEDYKHFTDNEEEDNYPVNSRQSQMYHRKYVPPTPVIPTPPPSSSQSSSSITNSVLENSSLSITTSKEEKSPPPVLIKEVRFQDVHDKPTVNNNIVSPTNSIMSESIYYSRESSQEGK